MSAPFDQFHYECAKRAVEALGRGSGETARVALMMILHDSDHAFIIGVVSSIRGNLNATVVAESPEIRHSIARLKELFYPKVEAPTDTFMRILPEQPPPSDAWTAIVEWAKEVNTLIPTTRSTIVKLDALVLAVDRERGKP